MRLPAASQILSALGQSQLLQSWDRLSDEERQSLLSQIAALDGSTFKKQQQLLSAAMPPTSGFAPFLDPDLSGNQADQQRGRQLIADGKAGCLVLAGGQGTRLRFEGPKGMFPISAVKRKSLFQLVAEKTVAAGRQVQQKLPLAIMTSPLNHRETVRFFESHHRFGLDADQLCFFSQTMLPVLDQSGDLFLASPGKIAEGPDGNGAVWHHFLHSGLWQQWQQRGVRLLNLVLIDNPLADPFDAELFGYHQRQQNQISVKCILKRDPQEPVGVLVRKGKKIEVVEYSELPEPDRLAVDAQGQPLYKVANLSLFCFSMQFILQAAGAPLPLHKTFKEVNRMRWEGDAFLLEKTMAWKFERFIFDLLPQADKVSCLLYPRESCFAPLKNFSGEHSVDTVRLALQRRDQRVFAALTGNEHTSLPFEISQDFYYPTPELLSKWQNDRSERTGYLEGFTSGN